MIAHIKINCETGCIGRFSEKKHKNVFRTIATTKMELFVAVVSSIQPLASFTKNPSIGAMGVLTIAYSENCAGDQIRYCRIVGISSYLAKQTLVTSKFYGS